MMVICKMILLEILIMIMVLVEAKLVLKNENRTIILTIHKKNLEVKVLLH
jgi:hypothetical protein